MLVASEALQLPPELWVQTLRELLVPVSGGARQQSRFRRHRGGAQTDDARGFIAAGCKACP